MDARFGRGIGKVSVAIIVIQDGSAIPGHQQIDKTIVVVICRRNRNAVHIRRKSCLGGHVCETPVAVVAVEMVVRRRGRLVLQWKWVHAVIQRPSIDYIQVRQAIVVVVKPDATCARSFQQRTKLP